jgi:hypothetical protein
MWVLFSMSSVLGQEAEDSLLLKLKEYYDKVPRFILRAGILPKFSVEHKIRPNNTLIYRIYLGFTYSSFSDTYRGTYSELAIYPVFSIIPRGYLTLKRRLKKGKSIERWSGTYFSTPFTYVPRNSISFGSLGIGSTIGHQSNFGKQLYFSIEGGVGVAFIYYPSQFGDEIDTGLGPLFQMSLGKTFN